MIYFTNTDGRIDILSITAGCMEYRLFVAHILWESVTTLPRPPSRLERVKFGQLIIRKIIKMLPSDVRFKGKNAPNSISAGALPQTR